MRRLTTWSPAVHIESERIKHEIWSRAVHAEPVKPYILWVANKATRPKWSGRDPFQDPRIPFEVGFALTAGPRGKRRPAAPTCAGSLVTCKLRPKDTRSRKPGENIPPAAEAKRVRESEVDNN